MARSSAKVCLVTGVTVLFALLCVPTTSWLVRLQMKVLAGTLAPGLEPESNELLIQEHSVAQTHPNDFTIQLAFCLAQNEFPSTESAVRENDRKNDRNSLRGKSARALLTLLPRFDSRPELHAHTLRYLCQSDLLLDRPEEYTLCSATHQKEIADGRKTEVAHNQLPEESLTQGTSQGVLIAEENARRGEALDPANAFFPTMLSVTLLAQHRDAEALLALNRASQKPKWNDYASQEVNANIALLTLASGGEVGGFSRTAVQCSVLLPHLAQIRSAARVATALAVERELDGDRSGGLRIRSAIGRIGATMRNSGTFLSPFVGGALVRNSAIRPGGAPVEDRDSTSDAAAETDEASYVKYLRSTGHKDEADWFAGESTAGRQMSVIYQAASKRPDGGLHPAVLLAEWWGLSLLIFVTFLLTSTFGVVAFLLSRTRSIRSGSGFDRGVAWAMAVIAGHILLLTANCLAGNASLALSFGDVACFELVVFLTVAFALKRRRTWRALTISIGTYAATVTAVFLIAIAATWLGNGSTAPLQRLGFIFDDCLESIRPFTGLSLRDLIGLPVLAVQAVFLVILAVRSRIIQTPISVGIVRGYRAGGAAACGVLLLLYSVSVIGTLIQESRVQTRIARQLQNEGQYDAEIVGITWPGPVVIPAGGDGAISGN